MNPQYHQDLIRRKRVRARIDELQAFIRIHQGDLDLMAKQLEEVQTRIFQHEVGQIILTPAAVRMEIVEV